MYQRSLRNSQRQRKRESRMMLSESYNDPRFVSFEGITGQRFLPKLCSNLSQRGIAEACQLQIALLS
ncbi:MAG: hypothetical protein IRD7MM_06425 [Candidatus Midichloria mitochondrii]